MVETNTTITYSEKVRPTATTRAILVEAAVSRTSGELRIVVGNTELKMFMTEWRKLEDAMRLVRQALEDDARGTEEGCQ